MAEFKKLPLGIQTVAKMRQDDYLYVDKTDIIADLVEKGRYYFLSRPRRFGKSLLISTLQALFEGREELFQGLAIHNHWDWNIHYPVIKISFGGVARTLADMTSLVGGILNSNQDRLQVTCRSSDKGGVCLRELIEKVHSKYGRRVVILVDEYDKLIVDNLDQPEVAKEGREVLRDLYTTIKDCDEYIKFAFLVGVSKFKKVSIFSGLNNLKDITLDKRYATLCGYTQNELETVFSSQLQNADMEKLQQWYNGYNFLGESVYNPFDILLFIDGDLVFKNYWIQTGTPTFIIKLIQKYNHFVPQLDNLQVSESLIDSYDIENIQLEPILFQAGYLTIDQQISTGTITMYRLCFPNLETRYSFNDFVLGYLTGQTSDKAVFQSDIYAALTAADLAAFERTLTALFASIPTTTLTRPSAVTKATTPALSMPTWPASV